MKKIKVKKFKCKVCGSILENANKYYELQFSITDSKKIYFGPLCTNCLKVMNPIEVRTGPETDAQ